jgi:hypothetical protein
MCAKVQVYGSSSLAPVSINWGCRLMDNLFGHKSFTFSFLFFRKILSLNAGNQYLTLHYIFSPNSCFLDWAREWLRMEQSKSRLREI